MSRTIGFTWYLFRIRPIYRDMVIMKYESRYILLCSKIPQNLSELTLKNMYSDGQEFHISSTSTKMDKSFHHTAKQNYGCFCFYRLRKAQCVTCSVGLHPITIDTRNFQERYKKSHPALTTVFILARNLNDPGNVETDLVEARLQSPRKQ